MSELDIYAEDIANIARQLKPESLRLALTDIHKELRQRNKLRIAANIEPDGGAMERRSHPRRERLKESQIKAGKDFYYFGRLRRLKTLSLRDGYATGYDETAGGFRKFNTLRMEGEILGARGMRIFPRLHQARFLKSKTIREGALIGFMNGLSAYIAAAHQDGIADGIAKRPRRALLGLPPDDLRFIKETMVRHLAQGQS